jgi:hypothetical protein
VGTRTPTGSASTPEAVDFLDTKLALAKPKYKQLWDKSTVETGNMLADPPDSAQHYRRTAFRLSAAVATRLAALAQG